MKIIISNNKNRITISKREWISIGEQANWLKTNNSNKLISEAIYKNASFMRLSNVIYFQKLGLDEELSNILTNYIDSLGEKHKKTLMSKVGKNKNLILQNRENLIKNPAYINKLLGMVDFEEKESINETDKSFMNQLNQHDNVFYDLLKRINFKSEDETGHSLNDYYTFYTNANEVEKNKILKIKEQNQLKTFYHDYLDNLKANNKVYPEGRFGDDIIEIDGKTMYIKNLHTERDIVNEGKNMSHCAGGYGSKVESGKSELYSLQDETGSPVVTIEYSPEHKSIIQIKGKGNRRPIGDYNKFIRDWVERKNIPVEGDKEALYSFKEILDGEVASKRNPETYVSQFLGLKDDGETYSKYKNLTEEEKQVVEKLKEMNIHKSRYVSSNFIEKALVYDKEELESQGHNLEEEYEKSVLPHIQGEKTVIESINLVFEFYPDKIEDLYNSIKYNEQLIAHKYNRISDKAKNHPKIQEAALNGWINLITKNANYYKSCPEEFKNHPKIKESRINYWINEINKDSDYYSNCPEELTNHPKIKEAYFNGWVNKITINPFYYEKCPEEFKNHPKIKEAYFNGWINRITKYPNFYKRCPEEFKNHPKIKEAHFNAWVNYISKDSDYYSNCPEELTNHPKIQEAYFNGWISAITKEPNYYNKCPKELKNHPKIQEAYLNGWISLISKDSGYYYKYCPEELKNHPKIKEARINYWVNYISERPRYYKYCPEEFKNNPKIIEVLPEEMKLGLNNENELIESKSNKRNVWSSYFNDNYIGKIF